MTETREGDIVRAYGHLPRTERCACGGLITADRSEPQDIERAVQAHQLSPLHQQWRKWLAMLAEQTTWTPEAD